MSKRESTWYVPPDWLWHFGMFLILPCIAVLASVLLPVVAGNTTDVATLYGCGVGGGVIGVFLLCIARLPLYRQRRFWTFGPRKLDRKHRRLYWLAYVAVTFGLLLLVVVWLRTR